MAEQSDVLQSYIGYRANLLHIRYYTKEAKYGCNKLKEL